MKYPPAPLTPFLASPPRIERRTHILNEQRELKDYQPTLSASIACRLLKSLASLFAPRILCFQRLAASFRKTPGGGGTPRLWYRPGTSLTNQTGSIPDTIDSVVGAGKTGACHGKRAVLWKKSFDLSLSTSGRNAP